MTEESEYLDVDLKRLAIGVRKRSLYETRDLAVRVLCKEAKSLLSYYLPLVLPVYLLDLVLWYFVFKTCPGPQSLVISAVPYYVRFLSCLTLNVSIIWMTVCLETAFVGSLTTRYLGYWLFAGGEKVDRRVVFRSWRARFFPLFHYLVFPHVLHWSAFYAETILLERAPFLKSKDRSSIRKRVRYIASEGGAVGYAATEIFYILPGVLSGCAMLWYFTNALIAEPPLCFYLLCYVVCPIFVFGCELYKVVFSFLLYVNYRISREGWDVRLAFESEIAKLQQDETLGSSAKGAVRTRRRVRLGELSPLTLESEDETNVGKGEGK